MHWGHCVSKDFIKWEYLPCALAPDESYDKEGCFSGSAIEADGEHVLIYTGVMDRYLDDGFHYYRQVQCMAKGDGIRYRKFAENPVITGESTPEGSSLEDFRDPKVWKEDDGFYLVVGSRAGDGSGQILMYRSEDLKQWEFVTILDKSENQYGKMWECPDFSLLARSRFSWFRLRTCGPWDWNFTMEITPFLSAGNTTKNLTDLHGKRLFPQITGWIFMRLRP